MYRCKRCGLQEEVATKAAFKKLKEKYRAPWSAMDVIKKKVQSYKCGPNCPLEPVQYMNKKGRLCISFKRMNLIQKDIDDFKAQQALKQAESQGEEARGGNIE